MQEAGFEPANPLRDGVFPNKNQMTYYFPKPRGVDHFPTPALYDF